MVGCQGGRARRCRSPRRGATWPGARGKDQQRGQASLAPKAASERMIAVDLYSGTGQATSAFRKHGWTVVAVDCERPARGRPPEVLADVRKLPLAGQVDFLWSSPPCQEFSDARSGSVNRRPSLEHIVATFEAVRRLRPRFWILENVRGAIPFLGIPVQKIGPWCLWGYFPPIRTSLAMATHRKSRWRSAAARAAVPVEFADAVYAAVALYWPFRRLLDLRELRPHRHVTESVAERLPW